jgi:predicted secreted Zn-dependent protease
MKKFLLCLVALVVATENAAAVDLVKTYSYYMVRGRSLDVLERQLNEYGPEVKSTGSRHPGATQMKFITRLTYESDTGYCRVASAKVIVKVKVILPRWRDRARSQPDLRFFWDTLAADIKRHEEQHVDIAKNHGRALEDALKAMGRQPDCETAAAKVKQISAKVYAEHDRAQQQFDRVELVNFESRILRLLQYHLEQMQAARKPA